MNNDRKDLIWEEIKTEHIVKDEWIDFRKSAYRFPDGSVFEPYYSYSRRNYVVIVASIIALKSVTLLEGYSLIIYCNEENGRDIRLAVYDSDGKDLTDIGCHGTGGVQADRDQTERCRQL